MKFRLPNKFTQNTANIARKCGYFRIVDNKSGQESFIRKLTQNRYPRFHLYISESPEEVVFDLHLDQTKTRYSGQTAHKADYESDEVKAELTRVYQIVAGFQQQ